MKKLLQFVIILNILITGVYATPAGDNIIISEVEYNPSGPENEAEWFELFNPTGSTIDISGWTIKEGAAYVYTFPAATIIASGEYLLVTNDTAGFNSEHAGVVPDLDMEGPDCYTATECLRLNNSGSDELTLRDGPVATGATIDYVKWGTGGYASAGNGESVCRDSSTDTDGGADWATCAVPTPKTGTLTTINHPPTDIKLDGGDEDAVNENTASGTTISVLTTTDPDAGDSFAYTLVVGVGDEDNGKFNISGNNLQLNFVSDYENPTDLGNIAGNNTYSIRLQTDDGHGGLYSESFIITVNDLNIAPTDISLSSVTIDEGVAVNTVVGILSNTDDGEDGTYTYTLVAAYGDNADFTITGTDLKINTVPDFETKASYDIKINVNDGVHDFEKVFTVLVNDLDENIPVITLLGANPANLIVGDVYVDAGATANDDVDGDITANIVLANSVNTSVAGAYTVTYNVDDSAGNSALEVVRNVVVNPAPVASVGGGGGQSIVQIGTCSLRGNSCDNRYPIADSSNDEIFAEYKSCIRGKDARGRYACAEKWAINKGYSLCYSNNQCHVEETHESAVVEKESFIIKEENKNHAKILNPKFSETVTQEMTPAEWSAKYKEVIIEKTEELFEEVKIEKICEPYLNDYLKIYGENRSSEVQKLQKFLREKEGFVDLPETGFFGQQTHQAVIKFQEKYASDVLTPWNATKGTGWVYQTTKKKINELYCAQ